MPTHPTAALNLCTEDRSYPTPMRFPIGKLQTGESISGLLCALLGLFAQCLPSTELGRRQAWACSYRSWFQQPRAPTGSCVRGTAAAFLPPNPRCPLVCPGKEWSVMERTEQVAQGGCGCPIPAGIQGRAGCGSGQPGLLVGDHHIAGGWNWMSIVVLCNPGRAVILYSFIHFKYQGGKKKRGGGKGDIHHCVHQSVFHRALKIPFATP